MDITHDILDSFRQGDHKAFEAIINVYFKKLEAFINGYVKSDADAKELADNIFVTLWENRRTIDPERSFDAYLYSIARNSALNFLKHKFVHDNYARQHRSDWEDYSSEDEVIAEEIALFIDMIVDKMPAQRKEIFHLSRHNGLSNEHIAQKLNTTKRNVESQLSQALKSIRRHIVIHD